MDLKKALEKNHNGHTGKVTQLNQQQLRSIIQEILIKKRVTDD